MSGQRRIKGKFKHAGYHVVTRTNHRDFRLDKHMRGFFQSVISNMKWLYEVRLHSWSILSNHYHICCSFHPPSEVDAGRAVKRWNDYHRGKHIKNSSVQEDREYVVDCLTDISHLMKKINTLMTREYNRKNRHVGTLWERRFRSTVVQRGRAMLMASAYIELNSFRASLVPKPEDYPYCSLYQLKKGNPGGIIETEDLAAWLNMRQYEGPKGAAGTTDRKQKRSKKARAKQKKYMKELYEEYVSYIYDRGTRAPKRKLKQGRADSIKITEQMQKRLDEKVGSRRELTKGEGLCRRIWAFTGGKYIGSSTRASMFYANHMDPGYEKADLITKHESRWMHSMAGGVCGVFNGSRRRQEGQEQKQKSVEAEDGDAVRRGDQTKPGEDERGRWIQGGNDNDNDQRGSPDI